MPCSLIESAFPSSADVVDGGQGRKRRAFVVGTV